MDPATTESKATRGRPRAFDRDAAVAVAMRLFWTRGYEATSIADLTSAMGIGSTSLYAAFGSKEALYVEALARFRREHEATGWTRFFSAATARDAIAAYLLDTATALTGSTDGLPPGCMVTLSSVGSEGHARLGELVRSARAVALTRIEARLEQAVADGEIDPAVDLHGVARYIQSVQSGMSILGRDGADRSELEALARVALAGWDSYAPRPRQSGGGSRS